MEPTEFAEKSTDARNAASAAVAVRKDMTGNRFNLPRSTTLPMLVAMNVLGKHIYPGTADPVRTRERRLKNRRARKARRAFRLNNARKGMR